MSYRVINGWIRIVLILSFLFFLDNAPRLTCFACLLLGLKINRRSHIRVNFLYFCANLRFGVYLTRYGLRIFHCLGNYFSSGVLVNCLIFVETVLVFLLIFKNSSKLWLYIGFILGVCLLNAQLLCNIWECHFTWARLFIEALLFRLTIL